MHVIVDRVDAAPGEVRLVPESYSPRVFQKFLPRPDHILLQQEPVGRCFHDFWIVGRSPTGERVHGDGELACRDRSQPSPGIGQVNCLSRNFHSPPRVVTQTIIRRRNPGEARRLPVRS